MRRVLLFLLLGGTLAAVESALLAAVGGRTFGLGLLTGLVVYLGVRAGNVDGALPASQLAALILRHGVPGRMQIQLHKLLWPDTDRGV